MDKPSNQTQYGETPANVFLRGDVYADRWSEAVRRELHIQDPLEDPIVEALKQGVSVVICGNAGDGKSHLALAVKERALGGSSRDVFCWRPGEKRPQVTKGSLLYVPDASQFGFDEIIKAADECHEAEASLLVTINEGPLTELARRQERGFFANIREVVHSRARGLESSDPEGVLIVNLAGRDLTRTGFIEGALTKLLNNIEPCSTCQDDACPRVTGARWLAGSPDAQDRVASVIRVISDRGRRVSARDIWVWLADLFYGWNCPPLALEEHQLQGFWWNRVFAANSALGQALNSEFDPVHSPHSATDLDIWTGAFKTAGLPEFYPSGMPPKDSRNDRRAMFSAAKRCWFFFADVDVEELISQQSSVRRFAEMVSQAMVEPIDVALELVGRINRFRVSETTQQDLLVTRHHTMTAWRRPGAFAYATDFPSKDLFLRVPYAFESAGRGQDAVWPTAILLSWDDDGGFALRIDYRTWLQLQTPRSVATDRGQEALDQALDLFFSRAPLDPVEKQTEIVVYDHVHGRKTQLSARVDGRRGIEVLGL